MDSDLQFHHHNRHFLDSQHHQQQHMNSGLMRYQSAPSSYFASLLNQRFSGAGESCDEFLHHRPSTPESDRIFSRFISSDGTQLSSAQNLCEIGPNSSPNEALQSHGTDVFHQRLQQQQTTAYSSASASQMIYQNQSQRSVSGHIPAQSISGMDNSDRVIGSLAMDQLPQMKMNGSGGSSNLIRHSSSPAGFFSNMNLENGYGVMGGIDDFGASNGASIEPSLPSSNRLKNKMDFSSGQPLSSRRMAPISENKSKSVGITGPEDASFNEGHRNEGGYNITDFPVGSWDDSEILYDSFLKRLEDDCGQAFSTLNAQNVGSENRAHNVLSHHLSLPKSSAELSAIEKLLQFQDSVPCKIRAKRGCATHPRSIAERVRRTRISERMKKLEELVPNMDKQTNTSDMLDLAVEYIKDLQRQVKILSENRAKCTCSNQQ